MNNFRQLQQLSQTSLMATAEVTGLSTVVLSSFGMGKQALPVPALERLCLEFSANLDARGQASQPADRQHPIHIRLSTDYLLNLGLTLSDWISLKWALEGDWQGDRLVVGFFDDGQLVQVVESEADFTAAFAGYLILALQGDFTPYIDEIHGNVHYDWRILRYRSKTQFTDITNRIAQTPLTEIKP